MLKVLAIVGPTAVGKSALAAEMAPVIGAEIISIDSSAIYRGMDLGTDKPSAEVRSAVPHHLVDVAQPSATVTVAEFQKWARTAVGDISARGKVPLLAGGSGLYFRAVVDPLEFPPTDPSVRTALEQRFGSGAQGAAEAYAALAEQDPPAAQRMEPANRRRTLRALEVIEITGRRFSEFSTAWEDREGIYDLRAAGVERAREEMD
ncbi:MAG: tRNA (adenosine(37)-N6)-dimethylallyltransferase MiaA, partial [Actinomycetota bacterium]